VPYIGVFDVERSHAGGRLHLHALQLIKQRQEVRGHDIDHTILKSTASLKDIQQICEEAKKFKFVAICIPPSYIKIAKEFLRNVGFTKVEEFNRIVTVVTAQAWAENALRTLLSDANNPVIRRHFEQFGMDIKKILERGRFTQKELDTIREARDRNWNLYQKQIETTQELQDKITEFNYSLYSPIRGMARCST